MKHHTYYLEKMAGIEHDIKMERAQLYEYKGTEDYQEAKDEFLEFYKDSVDEYNDLVKDGMNALVHEEMPFQEFLDKLLQFKKKY